MKCIYCSLEFEDRKHKERKYCSRSCAAKDRFSKNPTRYWSGKKRPEVKKWLKKHFFKQGHTPHNKGVVGYSNGGTYRSGHIGLCGEKSPSWRHGLYHRYSQWRKSVFERDDYTCQICGKRGRYLNAHHIKEQSIFPEIKHEISNGITMCRPCHLEHHKNIGVLNQYSTRLTKETLDCL